MGKKEPGVVMRLSLAWLARNLFAFAFVLAGAAVAQDATKPSDALKNEEEKAGKAEQKARIQKELAALKEAEEKAQKAKVQIEAERQKAEALKKATIDSKQQQKTEQAQLADWLEKFMPDLVAPEKDQNALLQTTKELADLEKRIASNDAAIQALNMRAKALKQQLSQERPEGIRLQQTTREGAWPEERIQRLNKALDSLERRFKQLELPSGNLEKNKD